MLKGKWFQHFHLNKMLFDKNKMINKCLIVHDWTFNSTNIGQYKYNYEHELLEP